MSPYGPNSRDLASALMCVAGRAIHFSFHLQKERNIWIPPNMIPTYRVPVKNNTRPDFWNHKLAIPPHLHVISKWRNVGGIPISAAFLNHNLKPPQLQTKLAVTICLLSSTILPSSQPWWILPLYRILVPMTSTLADKRRRLEMSISSQQRKMTMGLPNLSAVVILTIPNLRLLVLHCHSLQPIDPCPRLPKSMTQWSE